MNIPLTPVRFLRYAEQQFPGKTAVVCGDQRFTYAQFAERARGLAGVLLEAGVQSGDRVAFLSLNCHRLLEAYYGALEAGAVLLPLNFRLAPHELAYILNDSGAKVLFLEKEADVMEFDEDSLAELFYTSGTSANPKGVMLTHRNIYLHALSVSLRFNTNTDTVELHTIPLFHANGWGGAHSVTFAGGRHVMISRFVPAVVFRLIERERVHSLSLVPIMALALVNSPERPKYDLSSLQWISIGGAASSPTLVREVEEKLGCTCFSGYGLTETAPVLSTSQIKPGFEREGEQRFVAQAMTGCAIPGVELRVVDFEDKDVPRDAKTMGEIIARSDGVMAGYWRQPEASAEALRGGWFHTGDMATINEDGYILIVDRRKDIIVSGGENISSLEVEKALAAHPNIYEAAVIPVPDEKWGEVPKGLVVVKPGSQLSESELIEFCRTRLAHFKCPRSIEFVEALPKTATGKILKKNLRKKYWAAQTNVSPEFAPRK